MQSFKRSKVIHRSSLCIIVFTFTDFYTYMNSVELFEELLRKLTYVYKQLFFLCIF